MIIINNNDIETELYLSKTDEDKTIIFGIYPVMFGYRIRAGYIGLQWYELDWCAGDDPIQINLLYSICNHCLLLRDKKDPFKDLPRISKIKPFYNDPEFVSVLNNETSNSNFSLLENITSRQLQEIKHKEIFKITNN